MKRGDIVIAAQPGPFTGKPRPYLIVQRSVIIEDALTVTCCPFTSELLGGGLVRIAVQPSDHNGLDTLSELEIDKITTLRKAAISKEVGALTPSEMVQVDIALRRWLDL